MEIKVRMRISFMVLYGLLAAMSPHGDSEEEIMMRWDMNKIADVDALCDVYLNSKLSAFNELGRDLCKNTLLYRIIFDQVELACQMDNLQVVFEPPIDMTVFYTHIWERLFGEKLPTDLIQDDFYIDEISLNNLQRLVFDKG